MHICNESKSVQKDLDIMGWNPIGKLDEPSNFEILKIYFDCQIQNL